MAATGSLTERQKSLATALAVAKMAALAAKPGDDGGSANLDCAFLYQRDGLRAPDVRKAAEAAGVSVSHCYSKWWRGWLVQVSEGQGAMNARMAEAAADALRSAGFEATVYYQVN